eukprot:3813365-Rhodomonas_salina.2
MGGHAGLLREGSRGAQREREQGERSRGAEKEVTWTEGGVTRNAERERAEGSRDRGHVGLSAEGHVGLSRGTKRGGSRGQEGREIRSYFEEALQLFLEAHAEYMAAFGLDNSETIKGVCAPPAFPGTTRAVLTERARVCTTPGDYNDRGVVPEAGQ